MIRVMSLAAFAVAFLVAGGMTSAPAMAGGYHTKHHHGAYDGHPGYHYHRIPFAYAIGRVVGAFLPHRSHYYHGRRHTYHHGGHRHYRSHRYFAPRRPLYHHPAPRRHHYGRHGPGCHPVSKTAYRHGRLAKIGGTMCYDAYGNPYVVAGSRYVMHYYD